MECQLTFGLWVSGGLQDLIYEEPGIRIFFELLPVSLVDRGLNGLDNVLGSSAVVPAFAVQRLCQQE